MIIGFAQLTLSVADPKSALEKLNMQGWSILTEYLRAPSAKEKWSLLANRPNYHDLILLSGITPVEIVTHDTGTVKGYSRISLDTRTGLIGLNSRDVSIEKFFFQSGLGFIEKSNGQLYFQSRLPQWNLSLTINEDPFATIDTPLDIEGFSCLAFYSTDIIRDSAILMANGGRTPTSVFEIILGNKLFKILMIRSPEGTIIELIKPEVKS